MRIPVAIVAAFAAASLFAQAPLIEQGRAALSRGDSDAAVVFLEKAVAQSPKSKGQKLSAGSRVLTLETPCLPRGGNR